MRLPVSRKKYDRREALIETARQVAHELEDRNHSYEQRWGSEDGRVVLNALQNALVLIQRYQVDLSVLSAADPNYKEADALLERWGLKPEPSKIVAGFRGEPQGKTRWEREEKKWGDEAYGESRVRIMAERTEEGDRVWLEPIPEERTADIQIDSADPPDPLEGWADDGGANG